MSTCKLEKTILAVLFVAVFGGVAIAGDGNAPITPARAQEVALGQTGGGEVVELERRRGADGTQYFHLEIVNGDQRYAVEVDAADGSLNKFAKMNQQGGRFATPPAMPSTLPAPVQTGTSLALEQAQAAALRLTNGGTVVESEVRGKGGRVVYEFEIVQNGVKYEIDIDAANGGVLEFQESGRRISGGFGQQSLPGATSGFAVGSGARLDRAAAEALATGAVGGGQVTGYEFDTDDGRMVHEIKIWRDGRRYEVEIDDATGAVREMSVK